jgi:hypothetical protein
VYTPFRNNFAPLSFTNLVYLCAVEGTKKCPIYPCSCSLSLKIQTKTVHLPLHPLLKKILDLPLSIAIYHHVSQQKVKLLCMLKNT